MAVDPDSLTVARNPVPWFPDVIRAALVIPSPVNVVRPIAHLHSDGTRIPPSVIGSVIIRTASVASTIATTIIRSVARIGTGAVIASTSY